MRAVQCWALCCVYLIVSTCARACARKPSVIVLAHQQPSRYVYGIVRSERAARVGNHAMHYFSTMCNVHVDIVYINISDICLTLHVRSASVCVPNARARTK